MSFILPGALRRREPLRSGGDVPTCTVSEGSRDGAAFLNPEGEKDAPADRYWGIQSVSAHAPAATPTTAGLLAISKLCYKHSTNGESEGKGRGVPSGALSLVCGA